MIDSMIAGDHTDTPVSPVGLVQTEFGYIVRADDEYVIEVHRQLFNWRIVLHVHDHHCSPGLDDVRQACPTLEKGYCYFGVGLETLARAIAAAVGWGDPLTTDPSGFDRRAF